ncbi:unnamed protein product [Adineta steineri]|uniref:Uncharacterized protein n=1 Tax=Adineta steineri TaxID=433720 RepID=A0A814QKU5_9BILA|nr:unnamed protein product [Adineta steineri]CAF1053740.1 unnamed protein product [Adineta steineri]CAF1120938.1 unnamed protein product [Adineta steineri]
MGNDTRFIEAEDLPFRLIETPVGSAPPPPSPPTRKHHTHYKRHAPPPPPRIDGYDAPPSLLPPPIVPKRFDQPSPRTIPQRTDYSQFNSKKIHYHSRKIPKSKLACCVLS